MSKLISNSGSTKTVILRINYRSKSRHSDYIAKEVLKNFFMRKARLDTIEVKDFEGRWSSFSVVKKNSQKKEKS